MSQTLRSLKAALRICCTQLKQTHTLLTNRLNNRAHAQREYNEARKFRGYGESYAIKTNKISMLDYWENELRSHDSVISDLRHQCDKLTKDKEAIQLAIDKLETQQP